MMCCIKYLPMQAYMVELYQDTLVDLLLPKNAKRLRLDIKKDIKVIFLHMLIIICSSVMLVWIQMNIFFGKTLFYVLVFRLGSIEVLN